VEGRGRITLNLGHALRARYVDLEQGSQERRLVLSAHPAVRKFPGPRDGNNVSPRLGLAWDVRNNGKTVVRAGYGRLFNTIMNGTPGAEETTLRQTAISISNPTYPDPYGGRSPASFASTAPPNITHRRRQHGEPVGGHGERRRLATARRRHGDQRRRRQYEVERVQRQRADQHARQSSRHRGTPACGRFPSGAASTRSSRSDGRSTARCSCASRSGSPAYQYTLSYTLQKVEDNSFGATSTGHDYRLLHPGIRRRLRQCRSPPRDGASGAYLLPGDVTFGMVWTLRSTAPFSARAGVDLNGDGANTDYVPGTHKARETVTWISGW
jgi:hypothetical protein